MGYRVARDFQINQRIKDIIIREDKRPSAIADKANIRRDTFLRILRCQRPLYADEIVPICNAVVIQAYATTDPLIGACVDPRYKYVEKGCAPYIEWLGQKENPRGKGWAAGEGYGGKTKHILSEIEK